jgi:hypothetical protein
MNTDEKQEGDMLAECLIQAYWRAFTGNEPTWNFYLSPQHYTPADCWATRAQWIRAAKECVARKTKVLFGLEILLAEGLTEYMPTAIDILAEWERDEDRHDPEYYYAILAHLPHDNQLRRKYLAAYDADDLGKAGRAALIAVAVADEALCSQIASRITKIFQARNPDPTDIEESALPAMLELGPLCGRYLAPAVMDAARKFCLDYLQKDRILAPEYAQRHHDLFAGKIDERIRWICDDIAYLCWRLGWFDVLSALRDESWYWNSIFNGSHADYENTNLLIWSQYVTNDLLCMRALQVMKTHPYRQLDGAIAWLRMANCKWPP